jgi:serine/threonine protein kinase/lipopolysaccharide biosynthesis regulator YciM
VAPDRWARLQDAFHQLVDCPESERHALLTAVCGDDAEFRSELEEMLANDLGSEERLRAAIGGAVAHVVEGERNRFIGTQLGAYRITGVLGHGGMGTVYLARRADQQYEQKVAVKLVEQMAVHPQLRSRLRAERQILASLDHPDIARLVDGGETAEGVPYLIIEYIDGKPIDEYCDLHSLGVRERLQLLERVCAAVDYAHRNLIVHRDLKPGNILVTADGHPKLLDFGIAKLLHPDPATQTVAVTRMQDRLLTPEHAAPEQVLGRTITIAADIYTLGVLIYQLLCGRSPYALHDSTALGLERAICIEDPPRPSSLFRGGRAGALAEAGGFDRAGIAARRGVSVEKLRRLLSGDIDEIILKAMRKEPRDRYETAAQLAEDIRRHLQGEPVVARQGSRRYRAAKFVRRNAMSMSLVATIFLALTGFAGMTWLQKLQLAEQIDIAEEQRRTAQQVSAFLVDTFGAADPFVAQGREMTADELLERGAANIQGKLSEQSEVRAQMLESIGFVFQRQNKFKKAVPLLEQALTIRRQTEIPPGERVALSLFNLAEALKGDGNYASAEGYYQQALVLTKAVFGARDQRVAMVTISMARLAQLQARPEVAQELLEDAIEIYQESLGPNHKEVGIAYADLASIMLWKDELAAAERHEREALRILQASVSRTDPDYATALGALGLILVKRGELDDAEKLLTESLDLHRTIFGAEHPRLAGVLDSLGMLADRRGDYSKAIGWAEGALELSRRAYGDQHLLTGYYFSSLASLELKAGRTEPALRHVRAAIEVYRAKVAPDHAYMASSEHLLGEIRLARGEPAEAVAPLRHAISICTTEYGAAHWRTARSQSALGAALAKLGKSAEAEPLLVNSHRILLQNLGDSDPLTRDARDRLTRFLRTSGRDSETAQLLAPD